MKIQNLNDVALMLTLNMDEYSEQKGLKTLFKSAKKLINYGEAQYGVQIFSEEHTLKNKDWKEHYKNCIKIHNLVCKYAKFYLLNELESAKKLKSKIEKKANKLAGHCYHSHAKAYIRTIIDRINVLTPDSVEQA